MVTFSVALAYILLVISYFVSVLTGVSSEYLSLAIAWNDFAWKAIVCWVIYATVTQKSALSAS